MKAAAFEHVAAGGIAEAVTMLAAGDSRVMAGGQSLGPMLNLRLAQPARLVSVCHIDVLRQVEQAADAVMLGAGITHAEIADGRTPDITDAAGQGILARIAAGIAYQAVRNCGTIGGSLCHADPAADWVCTLTALGAAVLARGPGGGRLIPLTGFFAGPFRTVLAPGEMVAAVRIPRLGQGAGWGYAKACRKPGEFAHAMAAVLHDPARGIHQAVIGATGGPPVVLEGDLGEDAAARSLAGSGLDAIGIRMQLVILRRAIAATVRA